MVICSKTRKLKIYSELWRITWPLNWKAFPRFSLLEMYLKWYISNFGYWSIVAIARQAGANVLDKFKRDIWILPCFSKAHATFYPFLVSLLGIYAIMNSWNAKKTSFYLNRNQLIYLLGHNWVILWVVILRKSLRNLSRYVSIVLWLINTFKWSRG